MQLSLMSYDCPHTGDYLLLGTKYTRWVHGWLLLYCASIRIGTSGHCDIL